MTADDAIDHERALVAKRLGSIVDVPEAEIERAAVLQNEAYVPHTRNMGAVLARLAQLISLAVYTE